MKNSTVLLFCALLCSACEPGPFGPPPVPAHNTVEEGFLHAGGLDDPFLCLTPSGGRGACPDTPPDLAMRSCDSSGCHGSFDYSGDNFDPSRNLDGDHAPSCWLCHDREWNERKE